MIPYFPQGVALGWENGQAFGLSDGRPIGIEIVSPHDVSPAIINEILTKYSLPLLEDMEVAPLECVG
jgi:hypothetical protein